MRVESRPLPWRQSYCKIGHSRRLARCCRLVVWSRLKCSRIILLHWTFHWCKVRCSHSEDWQQLQGIHVSTKRWWQTLLFATAIWNCRPRLISNHYTALWWGKFTNDVTTMKDNESSAWTQPTFPSWMIGFLPFTHMYMIFNGFDSGNELDILLHLANFWYLTMTCGRDLWMDFWREKSIIRLVFLCFFSFRRKSMSGNWKTNQGSAMLEQMPITEKYKNWIDEVIKTAFNESILLGNSKGHLIDDFLLILRKIAWHVSETSDRVQHQHLCFN